MNITIPFAGYKNRIIIMTIIINNGIDSLNVYTMIYYYRVLADLVHFIARQPIIIFIIASKPMATIFKQNFPSEI